MTAHVSHLRMIAPQKKFKEKLNALFKTFLTL